MVPADCDTGVCQRCGVVRARKRARAITWRQESVDRTRLITFTQCPDNWQQLRGQIRDVRARIRSSGRKCEWIWTVERGSKTGAKHVHAIQHGDFIPQAELQTLWGGRIVDVRQVKASGEYISKSAARVAGYIGKGATADGAGGLSRHIGLNGGRLHHWSREFWGGLSIREAVRASRSQDSDEDWIVAFRGCDDDETLLVRAKSASRAVRALQSDDLQLGGGRWGSGGPVGR